MYWSWIDRAPPAVRPRWGGTTAFLGEVGPTGDLQVRRTRQQRRATFAPRRFRPAAIPRLCRSRRRPCAGIIVEPRVPTAALRTEAKVLGPAAVVFDPAGERLASSPGRTPTRPRPTPGRTAEIHRYAFERRPNAAPGSVIGFFWSPDGRSIAAPRWLHQAPRARPRLRCSISRAPDADRARHGDPAVAQRYPGRNGGSRPRAPVRRSADGRSAASAASDLRTSSRTRSSRTSTSTP